MHLTLQREELLKPLQLVIGVVERRQTLPILANVLIAVEGQQLSITATDLEIELVSRVIIEQAIKSSLSFTVSGRKLMDICRSLPERATLEIHQDKDRVVVRSGRSRFMLTTLPITDFPNLEEVGTELEFSIGQKSLHYLLNRTHFAMAHQDVRYYLNGMLLEIRENSIRSVATDGHRLSLNTITIPVQLAKDTFKQVIIPRKGVTELMRLIDSGADDEINMQIGSNHIRINNTNFTFTSKLIDGRFPEYEKVLPKNGDKTVMLDRVGLKESFTRASILSNEKFRGVRLQLRSGLVRILATNPEQEEAEEIIQTDYQGSELDIGFNVNYLLDILNTVTTEKVKLTFIDSNSSMLVEEASGEGNSLFVVMPLRL